MAKLGVGILTRARRLVPKDTFALHDSLVKVTRDEGLGIITTKVGVDPQFVSGLGRRPIEYWQFVERGTSRQAPQPYLMPALLQAKGLTLL
jgi:HK97 gp10 family phage protein